MSEFSFYIKTTLFTVATMLAANQINRHIVGEFYPLTPSRDFYFPDNEVLFSSPEAIEYINNIYSRGHLSAVQKYVAYDLDGEIYNDYFYSLEKNQTGEFNLVEPHKDQQNPVLNNLKGVECDKVISIFTNTSEEVNYLNKLLPRQLPNLSNTSIKDIEVRESFCKFPLGDIPQYSASVELHTMNGGTTILYRTQYLFDSKSAKDWTHASVPLYSNDLILFENVLGLYNTFHK